MPQVPESPSVIMPEFTDAQITALIEYMEAHGRARGREQGADFNETDYLAGCMSALFALGANAKIPAAWIFSTMAGDSPLGLPTLDREVYVVHGPGDPSNRESVTLYEHADTANEHTNYLSAVRRIESYAYRQPVRHSLPPHIRAWTDTHE